MLLPTAWLYYIYPDLALIRDPRYAMIAAWPRPAKSGRVFDLAQPPRAETGGSACRANAVPSLRRHHHWLKTNLVAFDVLLGPGLQVAGFVEGKNVTVNIIGPTAYSIDCLRWPSIWFGCRDLHKSRTCDYCRQGRNHHDPDRICDRGLPVEQGIVASMNRPEGNVTGVTFYSAELRPKRLELLRELVPQVATIAYLVDSNNPIARRDIVRT